MTPSKPPELLAAFARCVRGATATIFALAVPAISLLACGAIDIAGVNGDRSAMQDAADATALAMAKQLGLASQTTLAAQAQTYAAGQLGAIATADGVVVTTTVGQNNSAVTVAITGARPSFFNNLFPPGGWRLAVTATASTLGQIPLCVLSSGSGSNMQVQQTSTLTASNCLVQSNGNIAVDPTSSLSAGMAQASGTASGPITPTAQTGAPNISDPFASIAINPPLLGLCNPLDLVYDIGITLLTPGTHCGNLTVKSGATAMLLPGVYYFAKGALTMQDNSTLTGTDVVLIFNDDAYFTFKDSSTITLTGKQSGPYAGLVIATTRTNTNTFTISSTSAKQLEGAIYIPDATLLVTGAGNTVAQQSAWTVVVAQGLQMQGSPNLVINANYTTSNVPVPVGVGTNYTSGKVELSR
jgi:Flp pilus assembly protein TadG